MFRRVTFGPLCLHFVDRSCQNDASGHVLRRKSRWIHCVVAVVLLLAWLAWFRGREATTLRLPDGTLLTLVRLSWAAGATPVPGEGALIERLFREENLVLIRKRTSGVSAPSWNSADSGGLKSGSGGVFLAASSSS